MDGEIAGNPDPETTMGSGAIENLKDDELQELATRAQALLAQRREAAKLEAVEQARGILAAVGLTFRDAEKLGGSTKPRGKGGAGKPASRKGQRYVNPANAEQSWTAGAGRKPKWLTELEKAGNAPEPV